MIGSGGIARRRTIPEGICPATNARLVSVYDTDSALNAEVALQFGASPASSVEHLLAADIDAVYIASPPAAHKHQVLACFQAGKHVLCEKPLSLAVEEAEAMVDASRRAGLVLATAFMMRFHTQHLAALDFIRAGRLGQPVFARAQLSCWYPPIPGAWRQNPAISGGGSLIDMGGHCIDLLEMFFGPVSAVSCFTNRTVHSYSSEDSAVVSLRFANGALGIVDSFFCIPDDGSQNRLELYGSRGSILAQNTIGQDSIGEMTALLSPGDEGYAPDQTRDNHPGLRIHPAPANTYRAEIEEFSRALLDGRDPSNSAALGLRSQYILAACYDSAKTGRAIGIGSGP